MTTAIPTEEEILGLEVENFPPEVEDLGPDEPADSSGEKMQQLTKLLRHIGAIVLFAAAISFILQGWLEWDSLLRYYVFLGFSLVLSLAGVFCGVILKDDKGARTFMGVSAAIIPAHMTQLGALLYSLMLDKPADVPQMFLYQAPSLFAALLTLGIAAAFLLPIAYAGFSAMARAEAGRLTGIFALANAMLLIPTRDPSHIAVIAALTLAGTFIADYVFFARRSALKNWEGRAVRSMLLVPFVLLITRNLFLYGISQLLIATIFGAIAVLFFSILPRLMHGEASKQALEALSLVFVAMAWIFFMQGAFYNSAAAFHSLVADNGASMFIPLHCLPVGIIYVLMSFFATGGGSGYRKLGASIVITSSLAQLFVGAGIGSSFLCILVGIATLVGAFIIEEKGLFYIGGFGLAAGILYHFRYAVDLYTMSPWLTLGVTGIVVIVLSSYLERYYQRVLGVCMNLRQRVEGWS